MDDIISVIVPVYNAEKYIEKCVSSICGQTYQNLEIILVNDGSKDNSLNICQKLADRDCRIKVFDKPNGGAASARNLGLSKACGSYIGFCDADDFLDLNMYETLLSLMKQYDLETIECTSRVWDEAGNQIASDSDSKEICFYSPEESICSIFKRKGNVSLAVRLTKRTVLEEIRIPEGRRVEDFYFTICLLKRVERNALYQYPFYNCVVSGGSVTRSDGGSIYIDAIFFYHKSIELLSEDKYDFEEEKEYYLLKMYYLLALSLKQAEYKQNRETIREYKRDLWTKRKSIKTNKYLTKKERLLLLLSLISMRLPHLLYLIKSTGGHNG